MPSLVLGSALAFFPGVRSRNSVCRPVLSEVEGPLQRTGALLSLWKARPLSGCHA
jgi:hypothetical protein